MRTSTPTICAACAEVVISPAHVEPHKYMHVQERSSRTAGNGRDTRYRCLECDTVWLCHTDSQGCICGFKQVKPA